MKKDRWKPFFGSRLLFATLAYCDKDNNDSEFDNDDD